MAVGKGSTQTKRSNNLEGSRQEVCPNTKLSIMIEGKA